jgi:hypothetical protein
MKTKPKSRFEKRLEQSFRRMWLIAVAVGIASIMPLILFENHAGLVLASAVSVAIVIGLGIEIKEDLTARRRARRLAAAIVDQRLEAKSDFAQPYVIEKLVVIKPAPAEFVRDVLDPEYPREEQFREMASRGGHGVIAMRRLVAAVG